MCDIHEYVKSLFKRGFSPKLGNKYGKLALRQFIEQRKTWLAVYFIEKGRNLDLQNKYGGTLLNLAITKNEIKVAKLLIEKGANLNFQDKDYEPDIGVINRLSKNEVENLIIEQRKPTLNIALEFRRIEVAKLMIEKGADTNMLVPITPSYMFSITNSDIMTLLILNNVKINNWRINAIPKDIYKTDLLPSIFDEIKNNHPYIIKSQNKKSRPIYDLKVLTIRSINKNIQTDECVKNFKKAFPLLFRVYPGNMFRFSKTKKKKYK